MKEVHVLNPNKLMHTILVHGLADKADSLAINEIYNFAYGLYLSNTNMTVESMRILVLDIAYWTSRRTLNKITGGDYTKEVMVITTLIEQEALETKWRIV